MTSEPENNFGGIAVLDLVELAAALTEFSAAFDEWHKSPSNTDVRLDNAVKRLHEVAKWISDPE